MSGGWLEVSGAEGRDYNSARRANEAWLAGVQFKDSTTGLLINVHDIGPGLNVVIRYKDGTKVTNAEMPAAINPSISESEAKAILENLSHKQAEEWETTGRPEEVEVDFSEIGNPAFPPPSEEMKRAVVWPDTPEPKSKKPKGESK